MEVLFIFGAVISLPIIVYGIKTPKGLEVPQNLPKASPETIHEEISVSRFNAKLRQDRILESMGPNEKKMFLESSGYVSNKVDLSNDDFVKFINICTTIILLILAFFLVYYLTSNNLPSLNSKLEL